MLELLLAAKNAFSKSDPRPGLVSPATALIRGQLYRVTARVDPAYVDRIYTGVAAPLGQTAVQEHLSGDLEHYGFASPLFAMQDPSTEDGVWSFVARWEGESGALPTSASPFRFDRFEAVEEPPAASPLVDVRSLDVGLTEDDLYALHRALTFDGDPKRLAGLARSYDEDFPIAASLLRNKARLEDLTRVVNRETGPIRVEERANGTLGPESVPDHPTLNALKDAARDVDGGAHLDVYANAFHLLGWEPPRDAERSGHAALDAVEKTLPSLDAPAREAGFAKVLTLLTRTPSLVDTKVNVPDLAKKTGQPEAVVAAALAAVASHGHGLVTVDPALSRALLPHGPRAVSLGALKMAHAVMRPEGSLAAAPLALADVLTDLNKSVKKGDPMAVKAEASLKRARRFLDRQNWIAWYKRYQAAENVRL